MCYYLDFIRVLHLLSCARFTRYVPPINVTVPGHPLQHWIQPRLTESLEMFLDLYGLTQGNKVSY